MKGAVIVKKRKKGDEKPPREKPPPSSSSSDEEEEDQPEKKKKAGGAGGGGGVAMPPGPYTQEKHKPKLDKKLYDGGTQPDADKESLRFPGAKRTGKSDMVKKRKHELPIPVDDYTLQKNALYKAKLKKKEAQEEREKKKQISIEMDIPAYEYDPHANVYEDIEQRSDFDIFAEYNRQSRQERGVGELAASIQLRFWNPNAMKTDYTMIYVGRRGSGKTYKMREDLWYLRKEIPRALCMQRQPVFI